MQVLGVTVNRAVPPNAVNDAYKDVTAAHQAAGTARPAARGYAQQLIAQAEGEAGPFDKLYAQYKLAPEVTRRRLYYETMEQVLSKTDKTIVEPSSVIPYLPLGAKALPNAPQQGAGKRPRRRSATRSRWRSSCCS